MSKKTSGRKRAPGSQHGSVAWAQGYYCAVANLIRKDGLSTQATELFREGGGVEHAEEQDKDEFRAYGLLPQNEKLRR